MAVISDYSTYQIHPWGGVSMKKSLSKGHICGVGTLDAMPLQIF